MRLRRLQQFVLLGGREIGNKGGLLPELTGISASERRAGRRQEENTADGAGGEPGGWWFLLISDLLLCCCPLRLAWTG